MNFTDRTSLGDMLARRIQQLRGKDAVILCLRESSLLTCLTMASQLRAWVYPLIYAPVYTPDDAHKLLGAFDQDGEFCPLPELTEDNPLAKSEVPSEVAKIVNKQRPAALKSMRTQAAAYGVLLDKHRLDGRQVILAADVLTDPLPILVAQKFLEDVRPKGLTAVAGNATTETANLLRLSAAQTDILDILSGVLPNDSSYFEQADTYTTKQKHTLTRHIAAYWQ